MPTKRRSVVHFTDESYRIQLTGPFPTEETYEVFKPFITAEEIRYDDGENKAAMKNCDHYRWSVVESHGSRLEQSLQGTFNQTWSLDKPASFLKHLLLPSEWNEETVFNRHWTEMSGTFDWSLVRLRAYRSLLSAVHIKRQISILNFLNELRDLKKLFDVWSARRSVLGNIANSNLNYQFGWRPFLSDVCSILEALGKTRKKLKHLLKQEGKIRIHKGTCEEAFTVATYDEFYPSFPLPSPIGPLRVDFKSYMDRPKLDAFYTIKYSYFLPFVSELQARMRAFCDAFALQWDPQIIWDAIPFSFVVDWFFDVGGWLNAAFAHNLVEPILRIHEVCFSVSGIQTTTAEMQALSGEYGDAIPNDDYNYRAVVAIKGKRYHRHLEMISEKDLTFAGWTRGQLQKLSLGLSLITKTDKKRIPSKRLPRKERRVRK